MKPRYLLGAAALSLAASAAQAQYYPPADAQPYCREYTQTVNVGGQMQPGYGTACYQPDGSWEIVSDAVAEAPQAMPPQPIYAPQPAYVPQPVQTSSFSISFGSGPDWYPPGTRYYSDYGHHWRNSGHGWGHPNLAPKSGWSGHHDRGHAPAKGKPTAPGKGKPSAPAKGKGGNGSHGRH